MSFLGNLFQPFPHLNSSPRVAYLAPPTHCVDMLYQTKVIFNFIPCYIDNEADFRSWSFFYCDFGATSREGGGQGRRLPKPVIINVPWAWSSIFSKGLVRTMLRMSFVPSPQKSTPNRGSSVLTWSQTVPWLGLRVVRGQVTGQQAHPALRAEDIQPGRLHGRTGDGDQEGISAIGCIWMHSGWITPQISSGESPHATSLPQRCSWLGFASSCTSNLRLTSSPSGLSSSNSVGLITTSTPSGPVGCRRCRSRASISSSHTTPGGPSARTCKSSSTSWFHTIPPRGRQLTLSPNSRDATGGKFVLLDLSNSAEYEAALQELEG